jgi:SWIB/MDM2 domain
MDLSPLGRQNLTKTTGGGWVSLPHILALKMSSSVTVDKGDIATLEAALAAALRERQNRENNHKIASILNILDKAMNAVSKIKKETDILDKYPPNLCEDENYSICLDAVNTAAEASEEASILFASFVDKFNNLGLQYSTFTVPRRLSPELCAFLGVPNETMLSFSEVTTRVCRYARMHLLIDKQVIRADAALRKLLALTPNDELKILNLQRFLKPHYLRA